MPSTTMILNMLHKPIIVFNEEGFQLKFQEIEEKLNSLIFTWNNTSFKVLDVHIASFISLVTDVFTPGTYLTEGLWAHNWNLTKITVSIILILMIKSGHRFAHVMTALLSWHMQSCDLVWLGTGSWNPSLLKTWTSLCSTVNITAIPVASFTKLWPDLIIIFHVTVTQIFYNIWIMSFVKRVQHKTTFNPHCPEF